MSTRPSCSITSALRTASRWYAAIARCRSICARRHPEKSASGSSSCAAPREAPAVRVRDGLRRDAAGLVPQAQREEIGVRAVVRVVVDHPQPLLAIGGACPARR